jgi:hypothetical protein
MKMLVSMTLNAYIITAALMIPAAQAQTINSDKSVSQIVRANAQPLETNATDDGMATHFIDIKVQGDPISQLSIGLPPSLKITDGIRVIALPKQPVQSAFSMNGKNAIVNFSQPVPPGTTLRIALQGVSAFSNAGDFWLYPISVKSVGLAEDIPIGTARIETDSDD